MNQIHLPAGSMIRLTATARSQLKTHRWTMSLFAAGETQANAPPRLSYGSHIGERDCEQRIDVPVQDNDCRIEVTCDRAISGGWQDRQGSVEDDTPDLLVIGFADPAASGPRADDIVLSFAFAGRDRMATPR
jgi:hypothetical protein